MLGRYRQFERSSSTSNGRGQRPITGKIELEALSTNGLPKALLHFARGGILRFSKTVVAASHQV